jgi:SAM-dependent methyltransferase
VVPAETQEPAAASGEFVVPEDVRGIAATSGEFVVPEEVRETAATSGEFVVPEEVRETAATSGEFVVHDGAGEAERTRDPDLEVVHSPGGVEAGEIDVAASGSSAAAEEIDEPDSGDGVEAERSGEFDADGQEVAAQSGEFEAVDEAEVEPPEQQDGVPAGVPAETTPRLFIPSLTRPADEAPPEEAVAETSGAADVAAEAAVEGAAAVAPVPEDVSEPPELDAEDLVEDAAVVAPVREDTSEPPEVLEDEDLVEDEGEPEVAEKTEPPALRVAEDEAAPPPRPPPAAAKRPRKHWCDEVFSEHYAALRRPDAEEAADRDIEFLVESTELGAGATVLDVGCGDGAHCFSLAKRGFVVTGVDNSLSQLLAASQRNESSAAGVTFLHGDMRQLPVDDSYDAVICLGSTFGYFEEEQNRQTLEHLRDRLKPDGKLVLQVFNRDHLVSRLPVRTWWEGDRCLVLDEAEMNYFANRLRVHRTIVFNDGRQFEHYMFMRAFTLHDIGKLCSTAELRVLEVSGSRETRGHFFGATSPDLWILASRKPGE